MKLNFFIKPFRLKTGHSRGPVVFSLLLIALTTGIVISGCSSTYEVSSRWTSHELKINGTNAEWKDATTLLPGPEVVVGVKNDRENLYLFMETSNRMTQIQMLALGTTVWFSTKGEKERVFGIQFPVSGLLQGRRFPTQQNPEDFKHLIELAQRQFEVVGPGEADRHRIADKQDKGIDVHIGYADGSLMYELKIPLHKSADHIYALEADALKPMLIGLETGEYSDAMRAQLNPQPRSSAGSGGGRGGRGGGGGQGSGNLGGDAPEPLKHWLLVHLTNPN
jgi:hypothetical protein